MRRRLIAAASATALALSVFAGSALAANPGTTGQPSQDCSTQPSSPNGFNTGGFAIAGAVYANPADTGSQGGISSGNPMVVSQYDVACFEVSQH